MPKINAFCHFKFLKSTGDTPRKRWRCGNETKILDILGTLGILDIFFLFRHFSKHVHFNIRIYFETKCTRLIWMDQKVP